MRDHVATLRLPARQYPMDDRAFDYLLQVAHASGREGNSVDIPLTYRTHHGFGGP